MFYNTWEVISVIGNKSIFGISLGRLYHSIQMNQIGDSILKIILVNDEMFVFPSLAENNVL